MDDLVTLADRLAGLKQSADSLRMEKSKIEGKIEAANASLSDKFGVSTKEQAKVRLEELSVELDSIKSAIAIKLEELREYLRRVGPPGR